jgi:hypothetical protein
MTWKISEIDAADHILDILAWKVLSYTAVVLIKWRTFYHLVSNWAVWVHADTVKKL